MKQRLFPNSSAAFTIVELLVFVAIIAILAAIAVPNFLHAQVNAQFSRAKADMRAIGAALETYHTESNKYPWCTSNNMAFQYGDGSGLNGSNTITLERLTTPVSYLSSAANFIDPYEVPVDNGQYVGVTQTQLADLPTGPDGQPLPNYFWYTSRNRYDESVWHQSTPHDVDPSWWFLQSAGPDARYNFVYSVLNSMQQDSELNRTNCARLIYDPTNGTPSYGGIWRFGGDPTNCWGSSFYYVGEQTED